MPAPARLASQNAGLGRSCAKIAAAAAVASGRMPSTTPPCAAGTVIIAKAANSGKASTVQTAAAAISSQSARGGSRRPVASSTSAPLVPAMVARATVRNSGYAAGDAEPRRRQRTGEQHGAEKAERETDFFAGSEHEGSGTLAREARLIQDICLSSGKGRHAGNFAICNPRARLTAEQDETDAMSTLDDRNDDLAAAIR